VSIIVGIDEAGRGSWAGPLVVALVVLDKPIIGLNDSKKLSKNSRKRIYEAIHKKSLVISVGWANPSEIDELGLTLAERNAILRALKKMKINYTDIIIDGKYNFIADNLHSRAIVRADQFIPEVSAASIIAKVTRDLFMEKQALLYPEYFFERHYGYGTELHLESLKKHGPSPIHRMSYKPLIDIVKTANS
jgi:ribonuclease HII